MNDWMSDSWWGKDFSGHKNIFPDNSECIKLLYLPAETDNKGCSCAERLMASCHWCTHTDSERDAIKDLPKPKYSLISIKCHNRIRFAVRNMGKLHISDVIPNGNIVLYYYIAKLNMGNNILGAWFTSLCKYLILHCQMNFVVGIVHHATSICFFRLCILF